MALSSLPLWLVPSMTALAAILCGVLSLFGGRADAAYPRATRPTNAARGIVALAALIALVLLGVAASALVQSPATLSIGPRLARIGALDAAFSLLLTPTSAAIAAVALVAALAFAIGAPRDVAAGELAAVALVATGAVDAAMAEGFAPFVAGWAAVAIGAAVLFGRSSAARAARATAGMIASAVGIVLAAAVLFWSLGGQFLDGRRFLSDYQPRFTIATIDPGQDLRRGSGAEPASLDARPAPAKLSMLAPSGARVYLGVANEAQLTPRLPADAVAPFQGLEIVPGVQKIVIDTGGGAIVGGDGHDVALIDNVRVLSGAKLELKVVGSTTSFGDVASQVASLDAAYRTRTIGGVPVLDVAAAAILAAFIALAAAVGRGSSRGSVASSIAGLGGAALAAALAHRLGAPLAGAENLALVAATLAALVAVWSALVATRARAIGGLVGRVSGAWVALSAVSVVLPSTAAGLAFAGAALASVGLALGVERLADPLRNGADGHVRAAVRPAVIAMGVAGAVGAAAVACGALARGGALGVGIAIAAAATAILQAFSLARASAFMGIAEVVGGFASAAGGADVDLAATPASEDLAETTVPAKTKKKRKKGKSAPKAEEAAPILIAKPVDKPSFPIPGRSIALLAASSLGAVTAALWLSHGLGAPTTGVLQIGVAGGLVLACAAIAWRSGMTADDPKRRDAWLAEESILASAANPVESSVEEGVWAYVVAGIRAVEGALVWPLDQVSRSRRARVEEEASK